MIMWGVWKGRCKYTHTNIQTCRHTRTHAHTLTHTCTHTHSRTHAHVKGPMHLGTHPLTFSRPLPLFVSPSQHSLSLSFPLSLTRTRSLLLFVSSHTGVTNQVLVWECHKVRVFMGGIEWEVMVGCCACGWVGGN